MFPRVSAIYVVVANKGAGEIDLVFGAECETMIVANFDGECFKKISCLC